MSKFFKTATTWVVDFRYDRHPRRCYKLLRSGQDERAQMSEQLRALYGERAVLLDVRVATPDEEAQYLRGEEPKNSVCHTGRGCDTDHER